jgi:quercetin dioxygenase-like cupin family protein
MTITANEPTIAAAERGERAPLWFVCGLAAIQIGSEEPGGAYSVVEILCPPGDMPPLHVRERDDEVFYVVEGELELYVGGDVVVARPGAAVRAPRGIPHVHRVVSEGPPAVSPSMRPAASIGSCAPPPTRRRSRRCRRRRTSPRAPDGGGRRGRNRDPRPSRHAPERLIARRTAGALACARRPRP